MISRVFFARAVLAFLVGTLIVGSARLAHADDAIDYARDVLPILSANCYKCHGPEETDRQKDLRLDLKDGAFRVEEGVAVIVPGKPTQSELVRRITSKDPEEIMPPADDAVRKLSAAQIKTLSRWVSEGAKWGTHWAFVPPVVTGENHSIDAFVRERLEREKLEPAPQAEKATLVRRVTLDLTGLPPTPAEVDAFVADQSPDGYEKLVDRLLASPRYGERMASEWLDLARYADTHGYQMDRYRAMWPYRDWVIKAFNQSMPFDQFVTWQLAGDLLPNATKEERLATAFNRLHMQNEEGGVVAEEFRVAYVVDRVTTAGTALLGLTFECARCHDHKFDPITQKDFYSLFAFFQNVDESGQTSYFTDAMPTPALLLTTDEQDAKLATLRANIAAKAGELADAEKMADCEFEKWLKDQGTLPPESAGLVARCTFDNLATTRPAKPVEEPKSVDGKFGRGAALSGENGFVLPGVGTFSRADPFSLSVWLQTPTLAPRMVIAHKSKAPADAASRGYELLLERGRVAFGLHHFWPGNSLKVVTKQAIAVNEWTHIAVAYDGSSRAAGVRIYINGVPAEFEIIRDGLTRDIIYGGDEPPLAIGYRFRDNGFKGGKVDEFCVFNVALTPAEAARLAGLKQTSDRDGLRDYFLARVHSPTTRPAAELAALRREENDFITPIPEVMVMKEQPTTKPTFVLKRGAYDARGDAVSANTPAFLPPFPANQPRNRLGLAKWILSPENPLTARVTVNRAWQQMFGRGIVETSDNFGTQGSQPTHPELLDWLAREFSGPMQWDLKRLLKTIAMSATYRQSSHAAAELLSRDPSNALLARGPSRRLTAEMLRDQALFDSGLLVEKLGGPSVKPYQPDGLWAVAMGNPKYEPDKGQGLYRRSLYTYWKRSVPPPAMTVFDAADKNVCTVKRQSTSTPLQALTLLNDIQITEAARFVAQRMLTEGGTSTDDRIAWAFQLITGRRARERELVVLKQLYGEQRELFASDADAAKKLLAVGEKPNDEKLDRTELAAGTVLANAIFNHDAAIMRR
jgi:hypothetical protein